MVMFKSSIVMSLPFPIDVAAVLVKTKIVYSMFIFLWQIKVSKLLIWSLIWLLKP